MNKDRCRVRNFSKHKLNKEFGFINEKKEIFTELQLNKDNLGSSFYSLLLELHNAECYLLIDKKLHYA